MTLDEEIDQRYADALLRNAIANGDCLECNRTPNSMKYPKVANNEGAHRFIFRVKKGPIGSLWVLHTCDNMRCINPKHLFLGTPSDNIQDCINKGRATYLQGRPRSVSDTDIQEIKELRVAKVHIGIIATKFNISTRLVYRILAGEYDA